MVSYVPAFAGVLSLESELGEGGFLVNVVASVNDKVFVFGHVGPLITAGRVYFADEWFADSRNLVKCDVPDAAFPFAPTFGGDILFNIVVGVPGFSDDGARHRVVVEADGGVGARLWVACEPVAGGIPVEPSGAASCLVDGLHDALFNAWGDGGCVGGVLVGEVAHSVSPPAFSLGWSCFVVCLCILIVARGRGFRLPFWASELRGVLFDYRVSLNVSSIVQTWEVKSR